MSRVENERRPVILTVAGSDSGGGAGIQADIKTMTVLGCFGVSVITALTAQNGAEVRGIHAPEPEFVTRQLATVRDGFPVAAAKTGMLFSESIIRAVAHSLADKDFPLVVDPVAVSQSGFMLLEEAALSALTGCILPLADLLTPNRPEAEVLSGITLQTEKDVADVGRILLDKGPRAVLIKGGHFDPKGKGDAAMTDWLCLPGREPQALAHPFVDTANNHGTGCTLSAAIASFLGRGLGLEDAIREAQHFLVKALTASFTPGIGAGPPDFLGGIG